MNSYRCILTDAFRMHLNTHSQDTKRFRSMVFTNTHFGKQIPTNKSRAIIPDNTYILQHRDAFRGTYKSTNATHIVT